MVSLKLRTNWSIPFTVFCYAPDMAPWNPAVCVKAHNAQVAAIAAVKTLGDEHSIPYDQIVPVAVLRGDSGFFPNEIGQFHPAEILKASEVFTADDLHTREAQPLEQPANV